MQWMWLLIPVLLLSFFGTSFLAISLSYPPAEPRGAMDGPILPILVAGGIIAAVAALTLLFVAAATIL